MHELMALPTDEILEHSSEFKSVLDDLHESHAGGASFQLTVGNEQEFFRFAAWLKRLSGDLGLGYSDDLISTFAMSYDDLVRAYPGSFGRADTE